PRRAAALAAHARDGGRQGQASLGAVLRWLPAEREDRRGFGDRAAGAGEGSVAMPSITKPVVPQLELPRNAIGLTTRDYEGSMSTLCAGCGHDSITAALVRALWELAVEPHMIAKLSGIGCSSKTTAYFVRGAHGFNSVHGRMAAIATGAASANRDLLYI